MSSLAAMLHPTDLAWLRWVAGATMSTGILLVAAFVLDLMLRRRVEARWRVLLPAMVLLRLALPLQWTSPLGVFGLRAAVTRPAVVEAPAAVTPAQVATSAVPVATSAPPASAPSLAPMLHVGVALALLGVALASRWRASSALRGARPARESVMSLARGIPVVEHDALGPAVVGLLRPRIVMPSPLVETLAEEEVASVLRHEVAHVRRRDPVMRALVQLVTVAAWPVLPAWLAAWWLRGLVEQACDERALEGGGAQARGVHARALVDVATWRPRPLRLALGLLPFGEGVRARVKALRFSRRWATPAQVACVVVLAPTLVLTLGARAALPEAPAATPPAAETTMQAEHPRVPPLLKMRVERFRGEAIRGGGVPLLDDGEPAGELLDAAQADALRSRLMPGVQEGWDGVGARSLLDGRMTTEDHMYIPPDGSPGFEEVMRFIWEPASAGAAIDLSLTTFESPGDLRRKVTGRFAAAGDALHVVRFAESAHGAEHVLVTLENVVFTPNADARVESPKVSLDMAEAPLADVAKALESRVGINIQVGDAVAVKPVTLTIENLAWEDAVTRLVDLAGVDWMISGDGLRLFARASVAREPPAPHVVSERDAPLIARLRQLLDRDGVVVERIDPQPDKIFVVGRVREPMAFLRMSKAVAAEFPSTEMDIFDRHDDGSDGFALHLAWPSLVQTVVTVVRVDAAADVDALAVTTRGPQQEDPRAKLLISSASAADDFYARLDELEPGSAARVISRPIVITQTGQAATITSELGTEKLSVKVTARGSSDALVADVTLEFPWIPGGPVTAHLPVASSMLEIAEPAGGATLVAIQLKPVSDAP